MSVGPANKDMRIESEMPLVVVATACVFVLVEKKTKKKEPKTNDDMGIKNLVELQILMWGSNEMEHVLNITDLT